ncbi:hypothetical protein IQ269_20495 [Tychonema sp. LEGE 07199]|uniref:hypothetical protein n=1 Tax=Microcoleaceae TaxID=1892252 RepID=UPI00187F767A|nr:MULTISPECIES: hypothetical protein [unclassified Tychonema]MBE9123113.1 hypothetical protein [Tychonema sp. LEGE 07199]MBE9132134.1 hypothetical protein [Tychonema sp. LEGE 07196]
MIVDSWQLIVDGRKREEGRRKRNVWFICSSLCQRCVAIEIVDLFRDLSPATHPTNT